jgi:hypothetical protein
VVILLHPFFWRSNAQDTTLHTSIRGTILYHLLICFLTCLHDEYIRSTALVTLHARSRFAFGPNGGLLL